MTEEKADIGPATTRWVIDLDWLAANKRSFSILIRDCLCPSCSREFGAAGDKTSPDVLIAAVQKCCSGVPDFISKKTPVAEAVFRILLRNGNQPLTLAELGRRLSESRGGDPYRSTPELLYRIMKNDRFYGLQELADDIPR